MEWVASVHQQVVVVLVALRHHLLPGGGSFGHFHSTAAVMMEPVDTGIPLLAVLSWQFSLGGVQTRSEGPHLAITCTTRMQAGP